MRGVLARLHGAMAASALIESVAARHTGDDVRFCRTRNRTSPPGPVTGR